MLGDLVKWAVELLIKAMAVLTSWLSSQIAEAAEEAYKEKLATWRRHWASIKKSLTLESLRIEGRKARARRRASRAMARLETILSREGGEFTFQDLHRRVHPPSPVWLSLAATQYLSRSGPYHVLFRVMSPYSNFQRDFDRLEDVPAGLFDPVDQKTFVITPTLVTMILKSE